MALVWGGQVAPGGPSQGAQAQQEQLPDASKLVSDMLAHYQGLQSLTGSVRLVVTARASTGVVSETTDTKLAFEKPNKLYIEQVRTGPHPGRWLVTSDGKHFSYPLPPGLPPAQGSTRLLEAVNDLDVAHLYAATCTSLGDRSMPLGVATAWDDELRRIASRLATMRTIRTAKIHGQDAYVVAGAYREEDTSPIIGDFQLAIDRDSNLVEFEVRQKVSAPVESSVPSANPSVELTLDWDVNFTPNGKPDEKLFDVVVR